jgi:arginyl-tRNA synthetase
MLNLKAALAHDIATGLDSAVKAGRLPAGAGDVPIVVTQTDTTEHGDYASPVALSLTKKMKKPPLEIVEAIAQSMPKNEYIGKLEAAAPGFLNIRINPGWMAARLDDVIKRDLCTDFTLGQGKSVNLEFISANPTGPLTLANSRTAFVADTLGNILSCTGFNVTREYYINDAGGQVRRLGQSVVRRALQAQGEPVDFPEDLYQGDYIKELAATIAEELAENQGKVLTKEDVDNPAVIEVVSDRAAQLVLEQIKHTITEDLRVTFDVWSSEKVLRQSGIIEKALAKLRAEGKTYKKDGAEYIKTTDYGDSEDRVLVKQDGEYAYIAPDIGYHQHKYDRQFDLIFTFVGADHQGHLPKLRAAMEALGNDVSKLHLVVAQWFRLVRNGVPVKVSKRAGNIITPRDLIAEVGYDAARFFLLQHRLDTHMDLDLELAKEQSDRNPVYYVQYAYVRLQSILRRAKEQGVINEIGLTIELTSHPALTHTLEMDLMRLMYRWPEVVADCVQSFTVHQLTYYALELARTIHVFYKQVPVITAPDQQLIAGRLQLVLAAHTVLGKTLDLLGISKPEVM